MYKSIYTVHIYEGDSPPFGTRFSGVIDRSQYTKSLTQNANFLCVFLYLELKR